MGFILEDTFTEVICILVFLFWALYTYITKEHNYWKNRGVPYVQPTFPFGCQQDFVFERLHMKEILQGFYINFKNVPYFGIYELRKPVLVIKDPDLIKRILTKDFQYFVNRFEIVVDKKINYISWHLFHMRGKEWKDMRIKLTPTFSSGKMKLMFFHMLKCSEQLTDHLKNEIKTNPVVNVKDVLARFTMDIIASCAFGLDINSLSEEDSEFYKVGIQIFNFSRLIALKRFMFLLFPFLNNFVAQAFISSYVSEFLTKIVRETIQYREENNINRNDFLDLLIKIRQNKNLNHEEPMNNSDMKSNKFINDSEISIEQITAQCFLFFFAGFETASSTMSFCLYELSLDQDVQERLYQEIKIILAAHEGKPTYQALQEMTYLDQVINETLRRYASLSSLDRICTESYKIPNTDLVIEKGQRITIPMYAIHHDPDYYPDPYKFDPERFSPEKIKERHPYVHLPFGEGPRMCVGMRFGIMQTKIGLTQIISKFQVSPSACTQIPVTVKKRYFLTIPDKDILLDFCERETKS